MYKIIDLRKYVIKPKRKENKGSEVYTIIIHHFFDVSFLNFMDKCCKYNYWFPWHCKLIFVHNQLLHDHDKDILLVKIEGKE